jgi:DNA polymerase/3'-5' exonuclease PolX
MPPFADSEIHSALKNGRSGGTRISLKKNLDPGFAMEVATDFLDKTRELYKKAEIAGSLRRKEKVVHDVDFAVIPGIENYSLWKEKISERVVTVGGTPKILGEVICDLLYRGVQVNLFICPNEDSWGVTLMWATGPKGHTIGMTIKAQKKNLLYNSQGVWTREEQPKLIPTGTEYDVARVLDWKYKPPELRGKGSSKKTPDY